MRRTGRGLTAVAAAVLAGSSMALFGGPVTAPNAMAAPGTPGTPQAPKLVYGEDFENGLGTAPVLLTGYTGATGQQYAADPAWLTGCNGSILSLAATDAERPMSTCASPTSYDHVRQLAYGMGVHGGAADPTQNHSVTAYTEGNPGADKVQFETTTPISLSASNRYITFSVDAAADNCFAQHGLFEFYLMDGGNAIPTFTTPIDPCTDPRSRTVQVPAVGGTPARSVNVGTFAGNGSVLFSGSAVGVRLVNGQGSGTGNDNAFDNIRVLDATPQLDKSFDPVLIQRGNTSTLTLTVTNTSELAAKNDFSFTDTLPAGLTVASPAEAATTCGDGTVTANPGEGTVALAGGDLTAGTAACTVTVLVTSDRTGTYTNGPGNVTTVGIDAPGTATLEVADRAYTVTKTADASKATEGSTVRYTLTVTNTGGLPYPADAPASFTDDLTAVLDDATYNGDATGGATYTEPVLSWSGPLDVGASATITYSVTVHDPITGDRKLDNVVLTPPEAGGNCATGSTDNACRNRTTVPAPEDELADTGASVLRLLATAAALVAAGCATLWFGRRRRSR